MMFIGVLCGGADSRAIVFYEQDVVACPKDRITQGKPVFVIHPDFNEERLCHVVLILDTGTEKRIREVLR